MACAAADPPNRVRQALEGAGLSLLFRQQVIPRAGKPPFLTLFIATRAGEVSPQKGPRLTLRDRDGRRTLQHKQVRSWTNVGP